ncbi:DcrB-related protein [Serinicoccus kebangsaanensis]|uniref:DcrB-related protein n=1 Tax=Serinicoccus kebangsaanensis TaxID=2602069 RepID=UPI00124D0075|nr:DcrB-related protein [Serinicoccus kebangsaanensis]
MTTTRASLRNAAAAGLLAVLAVAGCAQEEPVAEPPATSTASEEPSPSPSDDAEQTSAADEESQTEEAAATSEPEEPEALELSPEGDAFTVTLPGTWEDATSTAQEQTETAVLAGRDSERVDDFYSNIVITEEEYVGNLTSAVERAAEDLAGEDGEYELLDPAEVDGNRAPGYTLVREVQDATVHQTQRWISHDGTLYVVTLSAVDSQAEDAAPVLEELLASWTWND